tara:strand:- start:2052 stop:2744 length:693 start_codon:yes stop_codon:yes gene_type:complete
MIDSTIGTNFLTTAQYESQQLEAAGDEDPLGRDAFLLLLTEQLTNQDPLDPMNNEAFVAQLAQFSALEANVGMQGSLEDLAAGMRQDQLLAGANLVGKGVVVEGGTFQGGNGAVVNGSVKLDYGAQDLLFTVHDQDTGELVFQENMGSRVPGDHNVSWNGLTTSGRVAPAGNYIMSGNAMLNGELQKAPISTVTEVKSVRWDPRLQELTLEINDGSYVSLLQVQRISSYE